MTGYRSSGYMNTARVSPDEYLRNFLADARKRHTEDNLRAVLIYGSYIEGYFAPTESDYDILMFFGRQPDPEHRPAMEQKYPRISLMYYLTIPELEERIENGSWSLYITVLKGAGVLYQDETFKQFVSGLKDFDMRKHISNKEATKKITEKFDEEIKAQSQREKFEAVKWFVPTVRRMLQILTYLRYHQTVWGLQQNLQMLQDTLANDDMAFMRQMQQRLLDRSTSFSPGDKRCAMAILNKLRNAVLNELDT